VLLRNRKFLQVDLTEPDYDEQDRVNMVGADRGTAFRSVTKYNMHGKRYFSMEKYSVLNKPKSCMKVGTESRVRGQGVRLQVGPCRHATEVRGYDCGILEARPGEEAVCCCKGERRHQFKCNNV
jgi:hypothetical protein